MKETVILELHLSGEGESKAAPDMVQLLPAGRITARDGRVFVLNDPEAVVERSKLSGGIDLPIDYEHQNDNPESRKNGPVPAAGWIKELIARPDGIWGRVEWTDRARQLITAREYRYLSPALLLARGSDVVLRIKGAGLVHNPALELTALAREEEDAAPALARIAEALGLDADAGEVAILTAIHDTATPATARFMPANMESRNAGCANCTNTANTASYAPRGQLQVAISACSNTIVTPASAASWRALAIALGA